MQGSIGLKGHVLVEENMSLKIYPNSAYREDKTDA